MYCGALENAAWCLHKTIRVLEGKARFLDARGCRMRINYKRLHICVLVMFLASSLIAVVRLWKALTRRGRASTAENKPSGAKCRVRPMGCFEALPPIFVPDMVSSSLTPAKCFKFCDDMFMLYSSLHSGHTCYCGDNLLGVARLSSASGNCTSKCTGNNGKRCGGTKSSEVFMVTSCDTAIGVERMGGCLMKTRRGFLQLHYGRTGREACIDRCANKGFTVAIPGRKCTCGHRINVRSNGRGATCVKGALYRTLAPDDICENKTLLPSDTVPPIALASFPGSGNTWFRQMIETATGVYTGSVYDEDSIFTHGFVGEKLPPTSGKTIVIKDHVMHSLEEIKYHSAILLIRNPYDALLAEYNRFRTLGHVDSVNKEFFKSKDFHQFVSRKAAVWKNTYSKMIMKVPKLLPIYFEDSVRDAVGQTQRVLAFLPPKSLVHRPDLIKRLKCLEIDLTGKYKRPNRKLNFEPFTDDLKNKVNDNIEGLRRELARVNITSLPRYEKRVMERGNSREKSFKSQDAKIKVKLGK